MDYLWHEDVRSDLRQEGPGSALLALLHSVSIEKQYTKDEIHAYVYICLLPCQVYSLTR